VYRRDLDRNLTPFFGGFWLHEVEPPDVRDWFVFMEDRGASVAAVRRAKAALSALYSTAREDGKVASNPVVGTRYVPSERNAGPRKYRPLTLAELGRFLDALPQDWRLFFLTLAHTGMRISEQTGLTWRNVNLGDDPRLSVESQVYQGERKRLKSANALRSIPLSPGLALALSGWRKETRYPEPDAPVFPNEAGGTLDYSSLYKRVLKPARTAAGIPAEEVGGFHAFRRTLGSVLHASGQKTDRQLADWLGHGDPAFSVRTYVGQMDDGLGSADFLDELIPIETQQEVAL
jgi:integrase